jgi:uncharacterized OsmC-like protein
MVSIKAVYVGEKHCHLTHGPSGASIETDAPKDNNGKGESFSPTDLMAAAMSSCTLTVMAIAAEKKEWDIKGSYAIVIKEMTTGPRRIAKLTTDIHLPKHLTEEQRSGLEKVALDCPVHHSIHPEIQNPMKFSYDV